ncbi:Uncharacterised protein [Candidatus Anstonella stagnisolia]|nr:Uncharacterised protein [Candidatus Anstonella stagnisolia]
MKKILLLAMVFGLFFAFGCLQNAQAAPEETTAAPQTPAVQVQKPIELCANAVGVQARDDCFMALALAGKNASMCSRIYSAQKVDDCMMKMAPEVPCSKLLLSADRDSCHYGIAKRDNSVLPCALISSAQVQQQCVKELTPPCLAETGLAAKGECLAYEKNDFSYCTDDACRYSFGIDKGSYNACLAIAEGAQKYACEAVVMNNSGICDNAKTEPAQDLCTELVAVQTGNINTCARATQGSDYRNGCYTQFAVNGKNYSLCAFAYPEVARDQCYFDFAKNTGIFESCASIVNTLNLQGCYIVSAKANNNPLACGGVWDGKQRGDCYGGVILSGNKINVAYCANIGDAIWKDKCYSKMAPLYDDKSLCQQIIGNDEKKACLANFKS